MEDRSPYAELFRTESREHLSNFEVALDALRRDGNMEHVAELFRSTHTIKGMAAAMGYAAVEQLAHALESFLEGVRKGTRAVDEQLLTTLLEGSDTLSRAVEAAVVEQDTSFDIMPVSFGEAREIREIDEIASVETLSTVRVDVQRLDSLLNLAGELAVVRDQLSRIVQESAELRNARRQAGGNHPLVVAIQQTTTMITALQDEVLQLRLVPVMQAFDRFPRLARDIGREVGKEVALTVEGRGIELDRSLLDALGDPVMHLLRNSIDHGIESPSERLALGKPKRGRLVLRAMRDRNAVVIQLEDDGRGIDRDAVIARAHQQGAIPWHVTELPDDQLLRVIAQPGLSTAESVTTISGRGVGIDVVVTRVRSMGGTVELETEQGKGTRFTLRLPTTLAITRALLVSAGGEHFALPAAHVVDVHEYHAGNALLVPEFITLRGAELPLVPLAERFGLSTNASDDRHLVVVDAGAGKQAVLVDEITGQQDIVVKRFQRVEGAQPWFSGATLLGDGTPALIVDLSRLG